MPKTQWGSVRVCDRTDSHARSASWRCASQRSSTSAADWPPPTTNNRRAPARSRVLRSMLWSQRYRAAAASNRGGSRGKLTIPIALTTCVQSSAVPSRNSTEKPWPERVTRVTSGPVRIAIRNSADNSSSFFTYAGNVR